MTNTLVSHTDTDGKWKCSREGACCELFAEWTIGSKCPQLKSDKSCGCYSTRPKVCRVDLIKIDGLDMNEYLIARCHLIHKLKEWQADIGENNSTRYILEKISKSGLQ